MPKEFMRAQLEKKKGRINCLPLFLTADIHVNILTNTLLRHDQRPDVSIFLTVQSMDSLKKQNRYIRRNC